MNLTKPLSREWSKICKNAFYATEMNAIRLIRNGSHTPNKLLKSAGFGYKQSSESFSDGSVAFELAS